MPVIDPVLKQMDSFTVSGLTVRTKNSDEFNPEKAKLPDLWQQFYSSNPTQNTPVYGVYSDYESDANGAYNLTAGTSNNTQDIELNKVQINSGHYLVFQNKGPMPQAVIETWMQIWDYFAIEGSPKRCFLTDFEEYKNGDEIAVYIGVK